MMSWTSENVMFWRMTTAGLSNWPRRFCKNKKKMGMMMGEMIQCVSKKPQNRGSRRRGPGDGH